MAASLQHLEREWQRKRVSRAWKRKKTNLRQRHPFLRYCCFGEEEEKEEEGRADVRPVDQEIKQTDFVHEPELKSKSESATASEPNTAPASVLPAEESQTSLSSVSTNVLSRRSSIPAFERYSIALELDPNEEALSSQLADFIFGDDDTSAQLLINSAEAARARRAPPGTRMGSRNSVFNDAVVRIWHEHDEHYRPSAESPRYSPSLYADQVCSEDTENSPAPLVGRASESTESDETYRRPANSDIRPSLSTNTEPSIISTLRRGASVSEGGLLKMTPAEYQVIINQYATLHERAVNVIRMQNQQLEQWQTMYDQDAREHGDTSMGDGNAGTQRISSASVDSDVTSRDSEMAQQVGRRRPNLINMQRRGEGSLQGVGV